MYAFIALCVQPNLQFPVFIYISYMTYYSHLIFFVIASGTSFIYIYILKSSFTVRLKSFVRDADRF